MAVLLKIFGNSFALKMIGQLKNIYQRDVYLFLSFHFFFIFNATAEFVIKNYILLQATSYLKIGNALVFSFFTLSLEEMNRYFMFSVSRVIAT